MRGFTPKNYYSDLVDERRQVFQIFGDYDIEVPRSGGPGLVLSSITGRFLLKMARRAASADFVFNAAGRSLARSSRFCVRYRGEYCRVKALVGALPPSGETRRGNITTFSYKSAGRLRDRFARASGLGKPWAVTLTFHEHLRDEKKARSRLYAWAKRLRRKFPKARFLYVREYHSSWKTSKEHFGVIHFHLALFGVFQKKSNGSYICASDKKQEAKFVNWMRRAWWAVCGKFSQHHKKRGVWAERVKGTVSGYYAKYTSKTVGQNVVSGRCWGSVGDFSDILELEQELTPGQFAIFRQKCLSYLRDAGVRQGARSERQLSLRVYFKGGEAELMRLLGESVLEDAGVQSG